MKQFFPILIVLFVAFPCWGETAGLEIEPKIKLRLYEPAGWPEIYAKPIEVLSKAERWKVRLHGLRGAPLHPKFWQAALADRTHSRQIVPIRSFYFVPSLEPGFNVNKALFKMRFKKRSAVEMAGSPQTYDPVFEVRFAGEVVEGVSGERPLIDRTYFLRFSAFSELDSGLFFRSRLKSVKIADARAPHLEVGKEYRIEIIFRENVVRVQINNEPWVLGHGQNLSSGLFALIASWHPIIISQIQIKGETLDGGQRLAFSESGLVPLDKGNR